MILGHNSVLEFFGIFEKRYMYSWSSRNTVILNFAYVTNPAKLDNFTCS